MKSATLSTTDLGFGLQVTTVTLGNLTAYGTAPQGERPTSWTVTAQRGRWTIRGSRTQLRSAMLLRGRAMDKVLGAVESGRI